MPVTTIILDIDETLIHAYSSKEEINLMKKSDIWNKCPLLRARTFTVFGGNNQRWWVVKRPKLDEFIDMCFMKFDQVIVWTAGCRGYADDIVANVFSGHPQPHYVFCRDQCSDKDDPDLLHKPIRSLRKYGVHIDLNHTFLIDDRICNFKDNGDNGIIITKYSPEACLKKLSRDNDRSLPKLMKWMSNPNFKPHINSCPKLV